MFDNSKTCGMAYFEMEGKRHRREITEAEFQQWYSQHCAGCEYMYEICMFEEANDNATEKF